MSALIPSFFLFSFFLFIWVFLFIFGRKKDLKKRVEYYLKSEASEKEKVKEQKPRLSGALEAFNQQLKKSLIPKKKNMKVELFLMSAGMTWTPGEFVIFRWLTAFVCAGLLYLLTSHFVLLLLGLMIGFLLPKLWVNSKRKKRMKKFNDGLADMVTSIINSLRAGFSFIQALKAVEEEVDSPIKEEIALVLKEMQYGTGIEEAFKHLYDRMPSQDLDIMIQAILIQRQVGGNLATVLTNIVDTIRERNKIHRQVKTLTAQGKMSGMVIGLMPFALGFIIFLIQPTYVGVMFTNVIGVAMLSGGLVSGIIGFLLIRKLTKIEV